MTARKTLLNTQAVHTAVPSEYLFLASAIAGRRVSVHLSTGKDVRASADGQTIVLPDPRLNGGRWVWESVAAQAALIGADSLEAPIMRRLVGRGQSALRYVYLEVVRGAVLLADRMPSAFLALPEIRNAKARTRSADESLEWALGSRALPETPDYFGTVRPLGVLRRSVSENGWSALTKKQASGDFAQAKVPTLDDDDEGEESRLLKLLQNPLSRKNPVGDLLSKLLGAGMSKGRQQQDVEDAGGAEIPVGRIERALRRGVQSSAAAAPMDLPALEASAASQAVAYPEWDVHARQYRQNWAILEEVEAWRPDGARDMSAVLVAPPFELKRQLGSLGLDHEMHRRQPEGAEFDLSRLLECAIDRATGHAQGALDIYRSSRRTRRDLAVALALDISGSTGEKNTAGISVFDQQLQVGYQIGRTLDQLGDTVAIYGFHSWGRHLVRAVQLKTAEERWSARVGERFAQLEPVGYTRTGTAIRYGTRLLTQSMRLPNRLLILVSDGIAYDQDYESSYAQGDARKALEEARASGTAVVCLCVGGSQDAVALRAIFGSANLLMIDAAHQLSVNIRPVCRQALAAVSQRKLRRPAGAPYAG